MARDWVPDSISVLPTGTPRADRNCREMAPPISRISQRLSRASSSGALHDRERPPTIATKGFRG